MLERAQRNPAGKLADERALEINTNGRLAYPEDMETENRIMCIKLMLLG
jgi:hypothetical protein